jgi:ADP-heptose:LPS heptosyltransferase
VCSSDLFLDRWIFPSICFGLTAFRKVSEFSASPGQKPKKIILIKLAEQGSTVLAISAIQNAIEQVGKENVYAMVFEENRFILDIIGLIKRDHIFAVRHSSLITMAFSTILCLWNIRKKRIDSAVDLEFFARFSAAITFCTGASFRSGLHAYFGEGPYRGDLMTHRIVYNAHLHTSQTFWVLVDALRRSPTPLPANGPAPILTKTTPSFSPRQSSISEFRAKLQEDFRMDLSKKIILLNPNASDLLPLRKWEKEKYGALARRILDRHKNVLVVFTGAAKEKLFAQQIIQEVDSTRCFNLAGKTTLYELMILYTLSAILVTNDSGPAHFASLTPIQTIVLFGPETPLLFAATGTNSHVIYKNLACSPCVNAWNNRQTACRDNQCMKMISVEEIFEKVNELLNQ